MSFTVRVEAPAPIARVYAYLADPRNRPEWQSSLRRIERLSGTGDVGSSWIDVTSAGVRPAMRVTLAEPPVRWAEAGVWRSVTATLDLRLAELGPGRTEVVAEVELVTPGLLAPMGAVLRRLAPSAVRSDLRRAARILAR